MQVEPSYYNLSRPADYYFCVGDCAFIDFINHGDAVCLRRISFDGYCCCDVETVQAIALDAHDSAAIKRIWQHYAFEETVSEPELFKQIVKRTLTANRHLLWEDALAEYDLIEAA